MFHSPLWEGRLEQGGRRVPGLNLNACFIGTQVTGRERTEGPGVSPTHRRCSERSTCWGWSAMAQPLHSPESPKGSSVKRWELSRGRTRGEQVQVLPWPLPRHATSDHKDGPRFNALFSAVTTLPGTACSSQQPAEICCCHFADGKTELSRGQ